jgi:hypothetical protein
MMKCGNERGGSERGGNGVCCLASHRVGLTLYDGRCKPASRYDGTDRWRRRRGDLVRVDEAKERFVIREWR